VRDLTLYTFEYGSNTQKYYAASVEGLYSDYEPETIQHTSIRTTQDPRKGEFRIDVPLSNPVAQLFIDDSPQPDVVATIYTADVDDIAGTIQQLATGVVLTMKRSGGVAQLPCAPRAARAEQSVPRGRYSGQCRHALYSEGCGVDKADYAEAATVSALDQSELEVQVDFDVTLISLGYVGGVLEHNGKFAHIVDTGTFTQAQKYDAVLNVWLSDIEVGDSVTMYPGCNHTLNHCANRFNKANPINGNVANFGGLPRIPEDTGTE